ncbi:hypothetical protein C2R22_15550 [Salinigranum rubrum]|uniref:Thioredoxin n=1 Tax=Salinigranum rubrum TaxID=755307 RepID=A0A2I8VLR3_9EURY|nr:thioredoxin family protein [Salinigranum rubrum]AUV82877.1 hypothetical protein C2R22_15550 [Salinigranum rubrum]
MTRATDTELLFEAGVLTAEGEDVSLTDAFASAVDDYEEAFTDCSDDRTRAVRERIDGETLVEAFVELGAVDPRSVAELCALSDRLDTTAEDAWLALLPVLRLFRPDPVPGHGAPAQAIPVAADCLPALTRVYSPALVYVWLDDCPPCESLSARLESTFETPRGVSLFAVYGPRDRAFLDEEYSVTAGPALLFMRDGTIDARLYGDQKGSVLRTELERLS